MLTFLADLVGGWTEVRTLQGYSYQISRTGKRRVVEVEDYGRRGEIDKQWMNTGSFTDEDFHRRFKNHNLISGTRGKPEFATF